LSISSFIIESHYRDTISEETLGQNEVSAPSFQIQ
jgi:hypothetical protein